MGVFSWLAAVVVVVVKIGLVIFFVDAMRRLLLTAEKISRETEKQTDILNTLVSAASAGNTDTRRDT
ncbi:MAG TPA: hypothetical protein PLC40_03285 [Candidatus Hydrogenedentes bacterium]|nr:MAG: hypothetical protein BWY09_00067 [Candidatus Hydrogenedentes bacterium ADurb.Bin179]HOH28676.1 hypothetical protein [Candidatus Hydrogenedentota bacterium]